MKQNVATLRRPLFPTDTASRPSKEYFSDLIHCHGARIYNFAHRLSGNDPDARDLVQEALRRAFTHSDRYDPSKPFDSWVMGILRNVFVDGMRRYERRHVVSLHASPPTEEGDWTELLPGNDPNPAEEATRREDGTFVRYALAALPAEYREAVVLCDMEGLSYGEIARVLDCPLGTVRSRIHNGRVRLRAFVERKQKTACVPDAYLTPSLQPA